MNTSCAICHVVQTPPRDGWVYENDSWVAGILPGLEVPGWIVVALRRHAVGPAPLEPVELADLARALDPLMSCLSEVTSAERVYLQAYGENEPHWHLLLAARGAEVPPEHRHVQYFVHRERYIDAPAAELVAARLRRSVQQKLTGMRS